VRRNITNLLEQAINCDDGDRAAKIIRDALGIETDDVANYSVPHHWRLAQSGGQALGVMRLEQVPCLPQSH
jgi:hypothetical protein